MQVLLNLQSNALKFTKEGNVKITVQIVQEYLEITVSDTGVGISEEDQSKLFKMFGMLENNR